MCAGMYAGRSMLSTVVLERGIPGRRAAQHGKDRRLIRASSSRSSGGSSRRSSRITPRSSAPSSMTATSSSGAAARRRHLRDASPTRATSIASPAVIVTAGGTPIKLGHPRREGIRGEGRVVLRDLRRRVLPESDDRRRRRRRRGGRGSRLPHALRREGVSHSSPRRASARRRFFRSASSRTPRSKSSGTRSPRRSRATSRDSMKESQLRDVDDERAARPRRRPGCSCSSASVRTPGSSTATSITTTMGYLAHRREHADVHSRAVRRGRPAVAAHASGDDRRRRRHDRRDRRREVSQGAGRRRIPIEPIEVRGGYAV